MDPLERVALRAASEAARVLKSACDREKVVERKSPLELVTDTDRRVEAMIVDIIRKEFPEHSVVAEESPRVTGTSDWVWYVDPLDGTTNFAHAFPHFAVSIAAAKEGQLRFGVVCDPLREETFTAHLGGGSFLNGRPIAVSRTPTLDAALVATGFPYDRCRNPDFYLSFFKAFMLRVQGIRRGGSAALDLCYVAAGRLDGFWEWKLHPWDTSAGALIVREAGGTVTDFSGNFFDPHMDQTLASNGAVHSQMLAVIREVLEHTKDRPWGGLSNGG